MDVLLIWLVPACLIMAGCVFWCAYEDRDMESGIAAGIGAGVFWPVALVALPFALIGWIGYKLGEKNRARRSKEERT